MCHIGHIVQYLQTFDSRFLDRPKNVCNNLDMHDITQHTSIIIRQRKELAELFGFETRNKYEILDSRGNLLFYCAEMQKGIAGFLLRQFFGHWRSFELHFFNPQKQITWIAKHPFRFIFQRLDITSQADGPMGNVEWKWGLLRKRFALHDLQTNKHMAIESGFFSFWTFPIFYEGREIGKIQKKWSGALKEIFTDADNFLVEFSSDLTDRERKIILSAAILVDLNYFEKKA